MDTLWRRKKEQNIAKTLENTDFHKKSWRLEHYGYLIKASIGNYPSEKFIIGIHSLHSIHEKLMSS